MRTRTRRGAAAILLGLQLSGCASWQVGTEAAAQLITRDRPSRIRVLSTTGDLMVIPNPAIRGDSVVAADSATSRVGVPIADVRRIELRRFSAGRTTLLLFGIISAGVIALKAYVQSISS